MKQRTRIYYSGTQKAETWDRWKNGESMHSSVGKNLDKSADFWGWTVDYGNVLESDWTFTFSLAYDNETERQSGESDKITQTYTPTLIWAKPINQRWSLFAGIAKGLFDVSEKKDPF